MPTAASTTSATAQHLMLTSKDHLEGARSFVEKRAANFKGE
jgi:enoyl-CoA hydratase/carnithine racemase